MARKNRFGASKNGKWDDSEERKSFARRRKQYRENDFDDEDDEQNLEEKENLYDLDESEEDTPALDEERVGLGDYDGRDEFFGELGDDNYGDTAFRDFLRDT